MNNLKSYFLLLILFLLFSSCKNDIKFDKVGWNQKGDLNSYSNREKMLNDLMENHNFKGMNYSELLKLLGEPENYSDIEAGVIYYNIITEYGSNIDPVNVKNLKIKLD